MRPSEPGSEAALLDEIARDPATRLLRPPPLSASAAGALVESLLGAAAERRTPRGRLAPVRTVRLPLAAAGNRRLALGRLAAGRYRLVVTLRDAHGNVRPVVRPFVVR